MQVCSFVLNSFGMVCLLSTDEAVHAAAWSAAWVKRGASRFGLVLLEEFAANNSSTALYVIVHMCTYARRLLLPRAVKLQGL
jgi:hypothetical protein